MSIIRICIIYLTKQDHFLYDSNLFLVKILVKKQSFKIQDYKAKQLFSKISFFSISSQNSGHGCPETSHKCAYFPDNVMKYLTSLLFFCLKNPDLEKFTDCSEAAIGFDPTDPFRCSPPHFICFTLIKYLNVAVSATADRHFIVPR